MPHSEVKLQAYKGLIRPVLEYASTAWDPHQSYLQEKLQKVQKRAARFITSNYNYEPGSMTTILKQTRLEPLKTDKIRTTKRKKKTDQVTIIL
jgi:hypothetical protein